MPSDSELDTIASPVQLKAGVKKEDSQSSQGSEAVSRDKTRWTTSDDDTLIAVLEKAREEGKQSDSGWKNDVWHAAVLALNGSEAVSGGLPKTVATVKTRWQRLKGDYVGVRTVREKSGFGWDEGLQMCVATNDVWEDLKKKQPHLSVWQRKTFPLFDRLIPLVEGVVATGQGAFRPGSREEKTVAVDDVKLRAPSTEPPPATPATPSPAPLKRESSMDARPAMDKKKKKKGRESGAEALATIGAEIGSAKEEFVESSRRLVQHSTPQRRKTAIQAVREDEGLSDSELVDVAEIFRLDASIADMYMSLPSAARTKYLMKHLEKVHDDLW